MTTQISYCPPLRILSEHYLRFSRLAFYCGFCVCCADYSPEQNFLCPRIVVFKIIVSDGGVSTFRRPVRPTESYDMSIFGVLKSKLQSYFNLTPYLEDEHTARQEIIDAVSFRGPNIIILILAILVASLGLNTDSTAVIIGAMLISPLMGPIIGIGLGTGTYDFALIKRSARNLFMAAAFSVMASTVYFLISPVAEGHSELLARTSPTIYDVLIGFFGGGAGFVAVACKQKGNVIPGVAIATALMPPLCTAGYGLATWQLQYFSGALYLFLINSIFIATATLIGVKLFKFRQATIVDPVRKKRIKRIVYAIIIVTLLPSVYLTAQMITESFFVSGAGKFVENNMNYPNTQVFAQKAYMKKWQKYLDVTLIGERVNIDSLQLSLTAQMQSMPMLSGTHLKVTQGFSTFSERFSASPTSVNDVFTAAMAQIENQNAVIDSLKRLILRRENFDSISYAIAPELQVLFPEITGIALSRTLECDVATRKVEEVNIALISHGRPLRDLATVRRYIETRTGLDSLRIIQSTRTP